MQEGFSYFSSWDWAARHGIPDPFAKPIWFSTGTVWYEGQPNIWGYWPSDTVAPPRAEKSRLSILEWPPLSGSRMKPLIDRLCP